MNAATRPPGVALTYGLVVVLALVAVLVAASRPSGPEVPARVIGPAVEGSGTDLEVLGGPAPSRWIVHWPDELTPGSMITVRLDGDCECEPYPPVPDLGLPAGDPVGLAGLAVLLLGSAHHRRRRATTVLRARDTVYAGPAQARVRLDPVWTTRWGRPHLAVRLVRVDGAGEPDGASPGPGGPSRPGPTVLGWVEVGQVTCAFTTAGVWHVTGDVRPGGVVGLRSVDGDVAIYPCSPLTSAPRRGRRVRRETLTVNRLLGWDRTPVAAAEPEVLPSHGRVRIGTGPGAGRLPEVEAAAARAHVWPLAVAAPVVAPVLVVGAWVATGRPVGPSYAVTTLVVAALAGVVVAAARWCARRSLRRALTQGGSLGDAQGEVADVIAMALLLGGMGLAAPDPTRDRSSVITPPW